MLVKEVTWRFTDFHETRGSERISLRRKQSAGVTKMNVLNECIKELGVKKSLVEIFESLLNSENLFHIGLVFDREKRLYKLPRESSNDQELIEYHENSKLQSQKESQYLVPEVVDINALKKQVAALELEYKMNNYEELHTELHHIELCLKFLNKRGKSGQACDLLESIKKISFSQQTTFSHFSSAKGIDAMS